MEKEKENSGIKGLSPAQIESLKILNSKEFVPCTYPWIRLTEKDVKGEYTFCASIKDHIGCVGKEETSQLLSLWNSPKAIRIRENLLDENNTSCRKECKVKDFALDTFLGYENHEYETFDPAFVENLLHVAEAIATRSAEVSGKPITLALFPSNICNIRCRMCLMEKKYAGDVSDKYFDGIKPLLPYLHELFVAGGEPFSCNTTRNIIFNDEVKRHNHIHVSTITNGTLLDEDVVERLSDVRLGRFIFSIDGVTPDVYNKIRIGADFDTVCSNVKRFVSCRDSGLLNVKVTGSNFVIQALNYHEIVQYLEFCHSLGIRASLNLINGSTELKSCIADVKRHVVRGMKRAKELEMEYSLISLESVLQKLPVYGDVIRKRQFLNDIFGEKRVTKINMLFDDHDRIKKIVKTMLTGLVFCTDAIGRLKSEKCSVRNQSSPDTSASPSKL